MRLFCHRERVKRAWRSIKARKRILRKTPKRSSRASETSVAIHKGAQADSKKNTQKANPLESTFEKTQMDCHADFQSARNDRKNATFQKVDSSTATNVSEPQKDSRICENTPTLTTPQAAGFCDDFLKKLRFVGCQGGGAGSYLSGNDQAHAADSRKSAQKPTPTPNDSKNCGGAGVALHTFGGRSYLGGNDYPPNVCNQSHCPPKAESPKGKVVAIDSIYTTLTPTTTYPNITLEPDLFHALDRYEFDLFFASDVLHHLSPDFTQKLLESIAHIPIIIIKDIDSRHIFGHYANADLFFASDVLHHLSPDFTQKLLESIAHIPIIIIKDIDSRHIFGHYANALHDLVFNQEKVCKIYPNKLESTLQALGYTTRYHYLPKLWYPHFLLLAYKPDYRHLLKDNDER